MIELNVSGFGPLTLEHLVSDFTGTLSVNGTLLPDVKDKLIDISRSLRIHVLTADTFRTARAEITGIPCQVQVLTGKYIDVQKEKYVNTLGAEKVVAFGNGINDRKMLKASKLGIAVVGEEGCAVEALLSANIQVTNIIDGLDLLLNSKRLTATLRY